MKKYSKAFILIAFLILGSTFVVPLVRAFQIGETMSLTNAEKRWGKAPFDGERFKAGTPEDRSKMAVDLIKKKYFVGKAPAEVFSALGRADGHFFSDAIPAYLLNEGWRTNMDTWQVVFLLNGKTEKVSEVIIQKNCCDSK